MPTAATKVTAPGAIATTAGVSLAAFPRPAASGFAYVAYFFTGS